jgi:hypothetical protein
MIMIQIQVQAFQMPQVQRPTTLHAVPFSSTRHGQVPAHSGPPAKEAAPAAQHFGHCIAALTPIL